MCPASRLALVEPEPVLGGHAEQPADHVHRQRYGELVDEVDLGTDRQ
jgi:hypothetical protein